MIIYPNNWIATKNLDEMIDTTYDCLIVGSGAGGGAVLSRLCELWKDQRQVKIGMLEKGVKLFHSNALNIATINDRRLFAQLLPDNSTHIGDRLPELPGARDVYALGGMTLFWNGTSPRPPKYELDQWPINPMELDVYFSLAEREMFVTNLYAKGSNIQSVLLNRLYANGFLEAMDLPLAIDMRGSLYGQIHSNPWFSSISSLAKAQFYRPFDLALDAFTSRVILENNKVTGVEVYSSNQKANIIRANNVIIAASALETPRILLNSDMKGNAIGRYLTNHMLIFSGGKINRNQFAEVLGNLSILIPESVTNTYQIQISGPDPYFSYQQFQEKLFTEDLSITETVFGNIESRSDNRVILDSSALDEYGIPMIQVNYTLNDNDIEKSNQMKQGITNSLLALGVTANTSRLNLQPAGSDYHESCTCRMGIDPETSAVDPNAMIHGVQGLYVAGNSVLPSLSAANPTLSTVALAIRLADHLASLI